jgi:hypothetical protein
MATVTAFPDLSQLLSWPTEHLNEAAEHWDTVGGRSYGVAHQVWRDALSVDWQGEGAEALRMATHKDMVATSRVADQLQTAAKVARGGAADLYAARTRVRYAVRDANTAGFDVDEEMSVIDRSTGGSSAQRAAREAQAQALAADIRQRATQLVALDQQVAGRVSAAVAGIRDTFPQSPAPETPPRKPDIHSVDNHTFKQDPPPPPDPGGDQPWKNLPSPRNAQEIRDALRQLPRGRRKPNRQLNGPEEIKSFWDWLAKNARDLPTRGDVTRKVLGDGTEISIRPGSKSGGPTIEALLPGAGKNPKVHLPLPFMDDPPQLPPLLAHPPIAPGLPEPGHPLPVRLPATQLPHPADLPPWLKDPSPPGFTISPVQQPPVFGWDQPDAPAPPVPHPAPPPPGVQSWLPDVGHDLSEGGKAVFGWVMVGGVLVWTILSGGGQGGEAAVP